MPANLQRAIPCNHPKWRQLHKELPSSEAPKSISNEINPEETKFMNSEAHSTGFRRSPAAKI